jgi:hypothetical protein
VSLPDSVAVRKLQTFLLAESELGPQVMIIQLPSVRVAPWSQSTNSTSALAGIITRARKKRMVGQAFQPDSEPCQAGKPDLLPCRGNTERSTTHSLACRLVQIILALYLIPAVLIAFLVGALGIMIVVVARIVARLQGTTTS